MWTKPSVVPRKRFMEPVHRLERSLWRGHCEFVSDGAGVGEGGGLTPKRLELSSGSLTGETSMKLNAFHWAVLVSVLNIE